MKSHSLRVMTKSSGTDRATPPEIYAWLDGQMHFTVDVCASKRNTKHARFYDVEKNGLAQSWEGETFWCNPPYGKELGQWMDKARDSAMHSNAMGVCLVPARVDVGWWHNFVYCRDGRAGGLRKASFDHTSAVQWLLFDRLIVGVYFHDQRICFDGLESAPFPSAFVFFGSRNRQPHNPVIDPDLPDSRKWPMLVKGWLAK